MASNCIVLFNPQVTQLFHVPVEERKYRDDHGGFGDNTDQQAKVCTEIMKACGVAIEINSAKDQSLTLMITGMENGRVARGGHGRGRYFFKNQNYAPTAKLKIPKLCPRDIA
jgi:hypothetical protein